MCLLGHRVKLERSFWTQAAVCLGFSVIRPLTVTVPMDIYICPILYLPGKDLIVLCMYVRKCVCIFAPFYTCRVSNWLSYVCTYVCMYVCISFYTCRVRIWLSCVCMYVSTYVYLFMPSGWESDFWLFSVCMYGSMHVRTYIYIYIYISAPLFACRMRIWFWCKSAYRPYMRYLHTYMHVYKCIWTRTCVVYTHIHTCVHMHIDLYKHTYVHVYICMYTHTCVLYTRTHICMHMYTHTYVICGHTYMYTHAYRHILGLDTDIHA